MRLVEEMGDDRHFSNQYVALRALHSLGGESVAAVLASVAELDWQQAALLTLLAARFDIDWQASEVHQREWLRRGVGELPSRIALAAAYVAGVGGARGVGAVAGREPGAVNEPLPGLLQRMNGLSRNLRRPAERVVWAAEWFWFLDFEARNFDGWPLAACPI